MSDLTKKRELVRAGELDALLERAAALASEAKSPNTKRAYGRQWLRYARFCRDLGKDALPVDVEMVCRYLGARAFEGRKVSSILQALAAIAHQQRLHGYAWMGDDPRLRAVVAGIRRKLGTRPEQKRPIEDDLLRTVVGKIEGDDLLALRDRALLLVGWVGAFRRSELVAINVEDCDFGADGVTVLVRRSKTDQEASGLEKAIPFADDERFCPVRALDAWLRAAELSKGAVFVRLGRDVVKGSRLSDQSVAKVIKKRLRSAGVDPSSFSGHSLRSGFVTTAAKHDRPLDAIMRQTGHVSERTVMTYIRHGNRFRKNAAKGLL